MTHTAALIWWRSLSDEEKLKYGNNHFKEEIELLGIDYVHRSNSRIEEIYRKEFS